MELTERCELCPRRCGANRLAGKNGFCGGGKEVKVARAALHFWEEPCISGEEGSGTVFFFRLHHALRFLPEQGNKPRRSGKTCFNRTPCRNFS